MVEEGRDYTIVDDPYNDVALCVIINGGQFDGVVGRYLDIEIEAEGRRVRYNFETIRVPPRWADHDGDPPAVFDDVVKSILMDIIRKQSQNKSLLLKSKKTGKTVDY